MTRDHVLKIRRFVADANLIVEVRDARGPRITSSERYLGPTRAPRLLVLAKADLADPEVTRRWVDRPPPGVDQVLALDLSGRFRGAHRLQTVLEGYQAKVKSALGIVRAVVVGLPNVGKSTLINRLRRRVVARVGDQPGVTRGKLWVEMSTRCFVLDTPGIIEISDELLARSKDEAWKLSILNIVPEAAMEPEDTITGLLEFLSADPGSLTEPTLRKALELGRQPMELLVEVAPRAWPHLPGPPGADRVMRNRNDPILGTPKGRPAPALVLTSTTALLALGVLAVFLVLSWEFLYREIFDRDPGPGPVAGTLARRDLYSPMELKVLLPSRGKETTVLRGERIASRGDKITPDQEAIIRVMRGSTFAVNLSRLWGNMVLTLACAMILMVYVLHLQDNLAARRNHPLLVAVIAGILAVTRLAAYSVTDLELMYLLNPVPIALILIAIFISAEQAVIVNVVLSILAGVLYHHPYAPLGSLAQFQLTAYALLGGLTGIFSCSTKQSQRSDILRAGLAVGLSNAVTILAFNLIFQESYEPPTFLAVFENTWYGLLNGIGCSMVVLGLIPYLEDLFLVTTSTRLLELINPNHPMLQKLISEAPGTYHHSQNVAHLAEKAAEEIGADPYLAKAASYYHDLGKVKRPNYFIENQMGGLNFHDSLTPQLSKLVIHAHTRDGAELGQKHGLPKAITDIMLQHHGTDLVAFFYHRALEGDSDGSVVDEQQYRYPGPKPQTKEAAIIMLADACEAAGRTLRKFSPQAIEGFVSKIINDKFADGQFDECDLTKRDCEILSDCFTRTLVAMHHARIEYPADLAEEAKAAGEGRNGTPTNGRSQSQPEIRPEAINQSNGVVHTK
ncbi:MAG: HDIG domain-containing protein [Candidatus Riflebacteria bacterium]|nr:HDIG domain-containing protein [Candidatus Riflebacteria bacterium]